MQITPSILLKGLATFIPGTRKYFCSSSGGTVSARYCYSVWLRHYVNAHEAGLLDVSLNRVAELGPGDSLGIGLCAVLCGIKEYYAFDVKPHANSERNKKILDELIVMFNHRERIPDEKEFPSISPSLNDYSFPHHILTDEILCDSLHPDRLIAIQRALEGSSESTTDVHIAYIAPWQGVSLDDKKGTFDMVFSQAVMEHVDKIDDIYGELFEWVRLGGFISHTIDYKSHGYTRDWNGHWAASDLLWKIVKGNRPYLINRLPHSKHVSAMENAGFQIVSEMKRNDTSLERNKLSKNFCTLSDDDLMTSGAFIQAKRL